MLTEEHNFDEALKKALGAEAAEKDVAAFSQEDTTRVNKLDSDGRPPYCPRRTHRPPGKGHLTRIKITALLNALVAEKQATHVPSGIEVPVDLNGIHLLMELDTGAGVSIISQETYNRHFKETPFQPCYTHLHTYTGYPVQVSGQFLVQLKYKNQNVTVSLLVVKGSGSSLFGRNWLSLVKLDWKKI